jgi:large subunit ribosomal protein L3
MLGLIGKKVGMTQVFDDDGVLIPVSVIEVEKNSVVGERTKDKDGYEAKLLGTGTGKENKVSKPYAGQFKGGVSIKKKLKEVRDFEQECSVGDEIGVELFNDIDYVDVIGISKGKGYQGVMKRHGFSGGRKTHGSKFHRANGSTGMAAWPSRVIKGTKMAGRMGGTNVTVQNLRVIKVDPENNVLLVGGSVPGRKDSFLLIRKAIKKA